MKKLSSRDYLIGLSVVYGIVAVLMNILCMKSLSFGSSVIICDGGQLISWMVFLISNVITEVWDEKTAIRLSSFVAVLSFAFMLLARIEVFIPTLSEYNDQASAFALIFSNGPRTIISSATAFWVGNIINVHIIYKIKVYLERKQKDRGILFFFRASFSTLIGQLVDNALFMTLAFAPIGLSVYEMRWVDILTAVISGTVIELVVESFFVPFITIPLTKKIQSVKEQEEKKS
ncbi:MAG: queuosine precursor transporter [Sphaerochaetaceae bacterium]|nr:queuosine precursor transporter [Sphaerochaetaceae bacterium]